MFQQSLIPAISTHQALKSFIKSSKRYGILMNFQLAQLPEIVQSMKTQGKKVLVHLELIKGLANDEFGAIYCIQVLKVDGIITTKPKVIELCRKRNTLGIMRFFLKDTLSLHQSLELVRKLQPDLVEVLPAMPESLKLLEGKVTSLVMLGGLIRSKDDVDRCLAAGAVAVTCSLEELW